jgi:hypothetical protein
MGGAYGTNRLDEECHELVAVMYVGRIRVGEQGNGILKWNIQTLLCEFIWIRLDAVSSPCAHGPQVSDYTKCREFLEQSNKCLHFAKGFVLLKHQDTPSHA